MKSRLVNVVCISSLLVAAHTSSRAGTPASIVGDARSACGYDISRIEGKIADVRVEKSAPGATRQNFLLAWNHAQARIEGTLTISCAETNAPADDEPVRTPEEVIIEEDAGGRYGRHIAWQKPLPTTNWNAQVAHVDYLLGDGKKEHVQEFLVCNSEVVAPCITLTISKPVKLGPSHIESVLLTLSQIGLETAGEKNRSPEFDTNRCK